MPRHAIRSVVILLSLCALSGCLLTGTVDEKGGAVLTLRYRLTTEAQLEPNKKRFQSPHVQLLNASVDKDKWATLEMKLDDVTKLSTTAHFQNTTVTLTDGEPGTKVLTAKYTNKNPNKLPEEMIAYFGKEVRVAITLPGEIVKSNATSTAGKTVTWTYPMQDFTNMAESTLTVTYKATQAGPAGAGTPAPGQTPTGPAAGTTPNKTKAP